MLNSRWHAPWRSYTASASASTNAGSETSVCTPLTSPRSASSVTVVWSTAVSTSAITTVAPVSSSACTMPRPMPEAPPVTTATFPFTFFTSAVPPHPVLVLPPLRGPDLLGGGHQRDVLSEVTWRGADPVADRRQRGEVEAVTARRGLAEHQLGVADGHVAEVGAQPRDGVRP